MLAGAAAGVTGLPPVSSKFPLQGPVLSLGMRGGVGGVAPPPRNPTAWAQVSPSSRPLLGRVIPSKFLPTPQQADPGSWRGHRKVLRLALGVKPGRASCRAGVGADALCASLGPENPSQSPPPSHEPSISLSLQDPSQGQVCPPPTPVLSEGPLIKSVEDKIQGCRHTDPAWGRSLATRQTTWPGSPAAESGRGPQAGESAGRAGGQPRPPTAPFSPCT